VSRGKTGRRLEGIQPAQKKTEKPERESIRESRMQRRELKHLSTFGKKINREEKSSGERKAKEKSEKSMVVKERLREESRTTY